MKRLLFVSLFLFASTVYAGYGGSGSSGIASGSNADLGAVTATSLAVSGPSTGMILDGTTIYASVATVAPYLLIMSTDGTNAGLVSLNLSLESPYAWQLNEIRVSFQGIASTGTITIATATASGYPTYAAGSTMVFANAYSTSTISISRTFAKGDFVKATMTSIAGATKALITFIGTKLP